MKKIAFLGVFCLMLVHQLNAQTDTTKLSEDDLLLQELGANDIKQSLLPEGMGLIRRSLWGEKGAMRKFNYFELTTDKRERELIVRRRMLQTHQALGFVALGGMVGSCITGQIMINTRSGDTQELVKPPQLPKDTKGNIVVDKVNEGFYYDNDGTLYKFGKDKKLQPVITK